MLCGIFGLLPINIIECQKKWKQLYREEEGEGKVKGGKKLYSIIIEIIFYYKKRII